MSKRVKAPVVFRDKKIILTLICVVFLSVVADLFMNFLLFHKQFNDQEVAVALEMGTVRARLEEQVNTGFSLIFGVASYIAIHPDISHDEFNGLVRNLLKKNDVLKNIGAAPDFVIRFMYPLEGNEKALGLDYRKVPGQWPGALAAKETGQMLLAGPVDLVQGGAGLIARVPVFRDDNGEFWGLVSAVIDFNGLLDHAGILSPSSKLNLALRGKDSKGEKGDVFFGDAVLFDRMAKSVTMPVSIPAGTWQMAAIPKKGWVTRAEDRWMIDLFVSFLGLLIVFSVIQQKRNTLKMAEGENRLTAMSRSSHDALVMIDGDDTITFWNAAAVSMFGYTETEMLGRKLHEFIVLPEDREKAVLGLKQFVKTGDGPVMNATMEMTAIRKNGEIFPVERSVASFQLGGKWCAVGSLRDITARKQYEEQLMELATTDALTGLSNRRHFLEMSTMALKKAVRYQSPLSLLMFDIDHFKKINDTYGHDAGDKVLQYVAATVNNVFRETDIPGRIGGEEFAVTMPETDLNSALMAAERLRTSIRAIEVKTGTSTITVTVSIGVIQWDGKTIEISQLIKQADDFLYDAKRTGRNKIVAPS